MELCVVHVVEEPPEGWEGEVGRPEGPEEGSAPGDPAEAGPPERNAAADTTPGARDADEVTRGRELFRSLGWTGCHQAEGIGRSRLSLDGVGDRLSADTLRAWVVAPRSVDPSVRKPAYEDLPEDEAEALVAYMRSLKGDGRYDG